MLKAIAEFFMWLFADLPPIGTEPAASVQAYASAAQGIMAVILAPITLIAAWIAYKAWEAARHQRLDALMPIISVKFDPEYTPPEPGAFGLELTNVGVGPALSVSAEAMKRLPNGTLQLVATYSAGPGSAIADVPRLIAAGETVKVRWLDPRIEETFGGRPRRQAQPFLARQENRRDINRTVRAESFPLEVHITYRDVFGYAFRALVPIVAEDLEQPTELESNFDPEPLALGETAYDPPKR